MRSMGVNAWSFVVNIVKPDSWTRRGNGVETGAELTAPSLDKKRCPTILRSRFRLRKNSDWMGSSHTRQAGNRQ
jgi:hypothetical protein